MAQKSSDSSELDSLEDSAKMAELSEAIYEPRVSAALMCADQFADCRREDERQTKVRAVTLVNLTLSPRSCQTRRN
jgi:hypothetical protein